MWQQNTKPSFRFSEEGSGHKTSSIIVIKLRKVPVMYGDLLTSAFIACFSAANFVITGFDKNKVWMHFNMLASDVTSDV